MAQAFARNNNANEAYLDSSLVWAEGSFKQVYKAHYTRGERTGQACVLKMMRDSNLDPYLASIFDDDLKVVTKAHEIISAFNQGNFVNRSIYLNNPAVWTFKPEASAAFRGKKCLVEPMIENFEKFNSNSGWVAPGAVPWSQVMQALSHFSYHNSGGAFVLCDIQGGAYKDGMVLTDPVVTSRDRRFGPTDLGPDGISAFFARHVCNQFCRGHWAKPHIPGQVKIKEARGTSMMNVKGEMLVPTRYSRPTMTGFAPVKGTLHTRSKAEEY